MWANKIACSILERSFAAYSFGAKEVAAARAVGRVRVVGWGTVGPGCGDGSGAAGATCWTDGAGGKEGGVAWAT